MKNKFLKKILFISVLMLFVTLSFGQQYVSYEYDNSGNRIKREMVPVNLASTKSATIEDFEPISDSWEEREVKIYPNPTKGNLKISISGGNPDDKYKFSLYDSSGKMMKNGRIKRLGEFPLNLTSFATGIYFLVLQTNENQKTYKIIKE